MTLKKLYDVTLGAGDTRDGTDVVIVLADKDDEARALAAGAGKGQIASIAAYPGFVSAVGPSRIVGRFKTQVA